jgi:hypothetical protein
MGLYTTISSLRIHLIGINLTTTGDGSTLPAANISRAEARLNSAMARRYDLTTSYFQTSTSIPPQVREWATILAAGLDLQDRARAGAGKEMLARGRGLVKDVMADLKCLTDYTLDLVATNGSVIPDMSDTAYRVLCNTTNYTPTFDEGDELSWQVDPDKLEDISTAKD